MSMLDSELAAIIQNELYNAVGADSDEIVGNRTEAIDYYFGRIGGADAPNTRDTTATGYTRRTSVPNGRSTAVSLDVADTLEAVLAQIMPTFSSDTVASFEARSEDDEEQARTESQACNYIFMQQNDGYVKTYQAVKDALLQKAGILKIYPDVFTRIHYETYAELDEDQQAQVQIPTEEHEEVELSQEDGIWQVKRIKAISRLAVEAVAPENFMVSSDLRSVSVSQAAFVAERRMETQTSLIEYGVDKDIVLNLPTYTDDTESDTTARNQTADEDEHYSFEQSMRTIEVWEVYMRVDFDEDDIGELRRILYCESNTPILSNEIAQWIPYAVGTPFIMPHRYVGLSLFDKVREIQDQKTVALRQYIDNMKLMNNRQKWAVENQVNMKDMLNGRIDGVIRVKSPDAVGQFQVPDLGQNSMNLLNYLDKMRSERSGASLDLQREGQTVGNQTAAGIDRQISFKEMLASMITKTLGETLIKDTYLLIHSTLKRYFPEEINFKSTGRWTTTNPTQWLDRNQIRIDIGMSQGERIRQGNALLQVLQQQVQAMSEKPNEIATMEKIYNTVTDFARFNGLNSPERYWQDPNSEKGQEAAQQNAQAAQQAAQNDPATKLSQAEMAIKQMQEEGSRAKDQADTVVKFDEQDRKWSELELEYMVDIAGKGRGAQ